MSTSAIDLLPPGACFIVFEGGEGAGKTTQMARLADRLKRGGRMASLTREPGGTTVGAAIRSLLLDPATGALDDRTEALLYAADRAEHVASFVRPALERGEVVLCDRYIDSSLAYQGAGRSLALDDVALLSKWATSDLVPDLTLVLDIDPRVGLTRFHGADRLEGESLAFHDRVRQAFLDLAAREPSRYGVIDASAEADGVERAIVQEITRWAHAREASVGSVGS